MHPNSYLHEILNKEQSACLRYLFNCFCNILKYTDSSTAAHVILLYICHVNGRFSIYGSDYGCLLHASEAIKLTKGSYCVEEFKSMGYYVGHCITYAGASMELYLNQIYRFQILLVSPSTGRPAKADRKVRQGSGSDLNSGEKVGYSIFTHLNAPILCISEYGSGNDYPVSSVTCTKKDKGTCFSVHCQVLAKTYPSGSGYIGAMPYSLLASYR
jgi:hypothetical protein